MNYTVDRTQPHPRIKGIYRLRRDGTEIGWVGAGARIGEGVWISKDAEIGAGAWIGEGAWIGKDARIGEGARIGAGAWIGKDAWIGAGAEIKSIYDYMTVGGIGSRQDITTFHMAKGIMTYD